MSVHLSFASISFSIICSSFNCFRYGRSSCRIYFEYSTFSAALNSSSNFSLSYIKQQQLRTYDQIPKRTLKKVGTCGRKITFIGISMRKQALQLQFFRQTGHDSTKASCGTPGYLHMSHILKIMTNTYRKGKMYLCQLNDYSSQEHN